MSTQLAISATNRLIDKEKILAEFGEYARVDLHLAKRTVYERKLHIFHFLDAVNDIYSTPAVRTFLGQFTDQHYKYENYLKALRLFYRFLGKEEVVSSFQFPSDILKPPKVPSKEQLMKFYSCIKDPRLKAIFLTLASSGLRISEVLSILPEDLDMTTGQITPNDVHTGESKRSWFSYVNSEALEAIKDYLRGPIVVGPRHRAGDNRVFPTDKATVESEFRKVSKISGVKIVPKQLRSWFACEMAELGMSDRYVDALCGRTPNSILARHYTDFRPEKLMRIYDKAGIKVLAESQPTESVAAKTSALAGHDT